MVLGKREAVKRTGLQVSDTLSLPTDTVTSTLIVYGGKGMGKTNFGAVLAEEIAAAGLRWSVLDPMGVWWGIRHSKDGSSRGVECLILGGAHGDIPIEPTSGAIVADLVVDEQINVVIDFSRKASGEMWGVAEKIRFVGEYGRHLFQRQGGLVDGRRREPIFQLVDEAARYMPQMVRAGEPDLAKCLSTWSTIVEEGRNIGLGVGLLTQRSARLNKDVAELADIMLAFRTVGPNSIAAVMDWLGEHVPKEQIRKSIETIRALPVGHCLAVSPGWLNFEEVIHVRERKTFDSSATPKPGKPVKRVSGEGARPDLQKYLSKMQEVVQRATKDDPKALHKRIAELEREIAKKDKPAAAPAKVERIDRESLVKAQQAEVDRIILELYRPQILKTIETFETALIHNLSREISDEIGILKLNISAHNAKTLNIPPTAFEAFEATPTAKIPDHVLLSVLTDGLVLTGPEQRIINATAWFHAIGVETPEQTAVAFLAGYSIKSSSFTVPRSIVVRKQLAEYVKDGRIHLTSAGRRVAQTPDVPMTNAGLHAVVIEKLPGPEKRLLQPLLRAWPGALDSDTLAQAAAYSVTSSSFTVPRSRLKSFGLIEYTGAGTVRARDLLFPQNG